MCIQQRNVTFKSNLNFEGFCFYNQKGILIDDQNGKEQLIEADTVILADMQPVNELRKAKLGVYTIGDALITRRGNSAILDGYRMGMRL